MTKKDFERIAQVFRCNKPSGFNQVAAHTWHFIVEDMCTEFKAINPRFDAVRFKAACEPQSGKQMVLKGV